jgi:hypothetical protein
MLQLVYWAKHGMVEFVREVLKLLVYAHTLET